MSILAENKLTHQEILELLHNKNISVSQYSKLFKPDNIETLETVIQDSSELPEKAVLTLFKLSNIPEITFAIFNHRSFPVEIIENYAHSENVADRRIAAQNPRLSIDTLCELLEDKDWEVKHEVLFNESMPKAVSNLYIDEIY